MAVLNITLEGACPSQGHIAVGVTVDAGPKRLFNLTVAEIQEPLREDDKEQVLAGILKLYALGKTKQQIRAGLQAGLEVVI